MSASGTKNATALGTTKLTSGRLTLTGTSALFENGRYENFYTSHAWVHDSGLEATGSVEVKARLVEDVMTIAARHDRETRKPGTCGRYLRFCGSTRNHSISYRAGMPCPEDVRSAGQTTNYGYIRAIADN